MFDLSGKRKAARKQLALLEAYRSVFASRDGQLVLADILSTADFFRAAPVDGALAHHNGMRTLAADILNKAKVAEDVEAMTALADAAYRQLQETDE